MSKNDNGHKKPHKEATWMQAAQDFLGIKKYVNPAIKKADENLGKALGSLNEAEKSTEELVELHKASPTANHEEVNKRISIGDQGVNSFISEADREALRREFDGISTSGKSEGESFKALEALKQEVQEAVKGKILHGDGPSQTSIMSRLAALVGSKNNGEGRGGP
jgi:cellobiose-specific phosphotransferase system component IIA